MKSDRSSSLMHEYRARLRPAVNLEALKRFLDAMPSETHRAAVLTFVYPLTVDDLRTLYGELGNEEALREFERLSQEPVRLDTPVSAGEQHGPEGSLPFVTAPHTGLVVQLQPPKEPELLALWRPIEPGFTDRDWPEDSERPVRSLTK